MFRKTRVGKFDCALLSRLLPRFPDIGTDVLGGGGGGDDRHRCANPSYGCPRIAPIYARNRITSPGNTKISGCRALSRAVARVRDPTLILFADIRCRSFLIIRFKRYRRLRGNATRFRVLLPHARARALARKTLSGGNGRGTNVETYRENAFISGNALTTRRRPRSIRPREPKRIKRPDANWRRGSLRDRRTI